MRGDQQSRFQVTIESPRMMHPHVALDEAICGGSPVIAGTRFPVRSVVFYEDSVRHEIASRDQRLARRP